MISNAVAWDAAPVCGPRTMPKAPGPAGFPAAAPVGPADRNRDLTTLRAAIARIEGTPAVRLDAIEAGAAASRPRSPVTRGDLAVEADTGPAVSRHVAPRSGDPALARRSRMRILPLGCPEADRALGGGFPAAGLSEIHLDETRDGGSLAGFALALAIRFSASPIRPLLWIADDHALSEAGRLYGPGLSAFGLDPGAFVLVRTQRLEDAAWAGEEAAISRALAMTVLEVRGNPSRLGLEGTRRLHLRAREAGLPFLLLRQSARPQSTAAPLRLRIRPGPAAPVADLSAEPRLIGHPVFSVAVEKSRNGRPQHFDLEWNPHERRFGPVLATGFAPFSRHPSAPVVDGPGPAREAGTVMALRKAS